MKSKVHPTYKTKYRVANWPAYHRALVRRGDVTVWLSSEAIAAWTASRSGRRGGQRRYSELAIETAMTLRLLYHLPLRQAEGFLHALFGITRLDLSVPDYTTLSRRSQHLRRCLRPVAPGEGLHLVLASTGLSIVGAGEWAAAKHGQDCERLWPWPAVARAGSDGHVGEAARPAPLEEGVRVPSPGPGGEHVLPLQVHHRRWPSRPESSWAGE